MKLGVVLTHRLHARNIVTSGLLELMAKRGHSGVVYAPDALADVVEPLLPAGFSVASLAYWIGGPVRRRLREALRLASLAARARTGSPTYRHKVGQRRPLPARAQLLGWRALGLVADPERLAQAIEAILPIRQLLPAGQIDALLLPTLLHEDNLQNDIVKAARRARVPVLAMPASWDNLLSKGCFMVRPDAVGVWGRKSALHAAYYHRNVHRVAVVGPPHFWPYVTPPTAPLDSVFYAGTSVAFSQDEHRIIENLVTGLRSAGLTEPVWYRPHPRRPDVTANTWFPGGVAIDPRWAACADWSLDPFDLTALPRHLSRAHCVVAAFSTVIIEAALCGRPSAIVGFGRSAHGPGGLLRHASYEHMQDVLSKPGITMAKDLLTLLSTVRTEIQGPRRWEPDVLRSWALQIADVNRDPRERIAEWIEAFA